jgi:hypothetical protein
MSSPRAGAEAAKIADFSSVRWWVQQVAGVAVLQGLAADHRARRTLIRTSTQPRIATPKPIAPA